MKRAISACAAVLMLAACQTPSDQAANAADAKPDPRQGKQVNQVCFNSQIRNWRENDRRSVIVSKSSNDEYKLDLVGTCQPQDAFTTIGLISRIGGGSCLSQGDKLVTDARYGDGPCMISRIYEWKKDAAKPAEAS